MELKEMKKFEKIQSDQRRQTLIKETHDRKYGPLIQKQQKEEEQEIGRSSSIKKLGKQSK